MSVTRVAVTVPFFAFWPIAVTHIPVFTSASVPASCSVIVVLEPTATFERPVGLSEVVSVNVLPFAETTGPDTEPATGFGGGAGGFGSGSSGGASGFGSGSSGSGG